MTNEMDRILKRHFGNSTATACEKLGVTRQAIYLWRKNGIPPIRRYHIEAVIAGLKNSQAPVTPAGDSLPA